MQVIVLKARVKYQTFRFMVLAVNGVGGAILSICNHAVEVKQYACFADTTSRQVLCYSQPALK